MTFDEALAALLAMVGERVGVDVLDAGGSPHLVATFGGVLRAGHSMTGGEPTDQEAIHIRLEAGQEPTALNLNRELYAGGMLHPDGSITLHFGGVALLIGRRA